MTILTEHSLGGQAPELQHMSRTSTLEKMHNRLPMVDVGEGELWPADLSIGRCAGGDGDSPSGCRGILHTASL